VISLLGNLIKFIQMMHIEDYATDDGNGGLGSGFIFSILTKKQWKLLLKVLMNLLSYFGLYFASVQLDLHLKPSDDFETRI
jgi:hypothetical protein